MLNRLMGWLGLRAETSHWAELNGPTHHGPFRKNNTMTHIHQLISA